MTTHKMYDNFKAKKIDLKLREYYNDAWEIRKEFLKNGKVDSQTRELFIITEYLLYQFDPEFKSDELSVKIKIKSKQTYDYI